MLSFIFFNICRSETELDTTPVSGDDIHAHQLQANQQVHDVSSGQSPQDNSTRARPRLIFTLLLFSLIPRLQAKRKIYYLKK